MEITFRRQQRSAVDMAFGHVSIMVELELEIKFLLKHAVRSVITNFVRSKSVCEEVRRAVWVLPRLLLCD